MLVTPDGIVMLLRLLQYEKASPPMLVTPASITAVFIDTRIEYHGALVL